MMQATAFFTKQPHWMRGYSTIRDVVKKSPNNIAILYGTHSGNTQKYATYLKSELKSRFNVNASLSNLADLDFAGLEEFETKDTLVFLVSTYGEGEPNDATRPFWNYVHNTQNHGNKFKFSYSVLSRGSSLYDNTFARAGVSLDVQLKGLGAHQVSPVGIQDKISLRSDDEYFVWKEKFVTALKTRDNLAERPYVYEPSMNVKEVEPSEDLEPVTFYHRLDPRAEIRPIKVKSFQVTDRAYVHADVHLPGYKSGDYVVIWPTNPDEKVELFLDAVFGANSERRNNLIELEDGSVTSYRLLAQNLIDVNGQPDHEFLLKIAEMAPTSEASQRAKALKSDNKALIPGLADLLKSLSPDVPWINSLPTSAFFDVLPQLEPRRYSVASSSSENPEWAGLTCVVERDSETGFQGVATGELLEMSKYNETEIMAVDEPLPSFRLPDDPKTPLLLFGVGTGVAPFRGFLRERLVQSRTQEVGPMVLFTGTRTRGDLIHNEEFEKADADDSIDFKLIPAYSRVDPSHPQKGYLLENVKKNEDLIFDMMERGGHIYVCGDVRKVRSTLRKTIARILATRTGLPQTEAKPVWKKLTAEGRTHMELW